MKSRDNYKVIGVMSGTSLDGIDLAYCHLTKKKNWEFKIQAAVTIPYSAEWMERLTSAPQLGGANLLALDTSYGEYIGKCCEQFIRREKIKAVDFIASHGHTIFHQTERKLTFQLGRGNAIYATAGVPVVFDFRSLDVMLGGQGAPLVPVGDRQLFGQYDICLNLGGIANLSTEKNGKRIAYDICFANMGLNYLAAKTGKRFDDGGLLAAEGKVDARLLRDLSAAYHQRSAKPALAREGFESGFQHLLDRESVAVSDRVRTFCESIAQEIRLAIPSKRQRQKILATGGGALNPELMKVLGQTLAPVADLVVPPRMIVEFKEALVFAFLGVLRTRGETNVLRSVTRATTDSCSGVIVGVV
jgi:anhydro-N-acetylmuramic acid kinase